MGRTTLRPPGLPAPPPVVSVTFLAGGDGGSGAGAQQLVCGDEAGGLRVWRCAVHESSGVDWVQDALLQLKHPSADRVASVVCVEPLPSIRGTGLAVSTEGCTIEGNDASQLRLPGAAVISTSRDRAVYVLDMARCCILSTIDAHSDVVRCMCALPGGSLATGGGKHDATTRVWTETQLDGNSVAIADGATDGQVLTEGRILEDVGYVFALVVLPDEKPGSRHWALAAARYNVIKVCL